MDWEPMFWVIVEGLAQDNYILQASVGFWRMIQGCLEQKIFAKAIMFNLTGFNFY